MSNYPPGVTGFEDQIAGPREEIEERIAFICSNLDCEMSEEWQIDFALIQIWNDDACIISECPVCRYIGEEFVEFDELEDRRMRAGLKP